ncbi:uncharacterized protein TRAVEDRAFT_49184 [Trametes versicolor FP-101664 SS1]|uniref:uncharacterized protein n=1 Tax=Trametes versicolor (strain FP-101664) TaxID=717944 RepID=UPI0004624167|nr:uncharacterized protein TRAVEDRAFT_49184 [Trametes versicolor FP-101664 SS1]EIW56354.1 hypothetical protein TRAVEDRAFT_49184 [Trametes versicolor FP-101664 SS1]
MDPSDSFSTWAAFLILEARTHSRLQHILFRLWPPSGDLAIDQAISRYALLRKLIGPLFIEVCHGLRSLRVLSVTLPRSAASQTSWDTSDWWAQEIHKRLEMPALSVMVESSTEHDPLWRLVWIDADNDSSDADDFDRFRCLTYPSPGDWRDELEVEVVEPVVLKLRKFWLPSIPWVKLQGRTCYGSEDAYMSARGVSTEHKRIGIPIARPQDA